MRFAVAAFLFVIMATGNAYAQAAGANPLSASLKTMHDNLKRNLTEAAAKMPEGEYGFQPTPEVRTFGQLVGHVANAQYASCARAKGEKNPNDGNDFEKKTAKADLVKALNDAVAYCDTAYGTMTDAAAVQMIKAGQNEVPRAQQLIGNISHSNEHYGNMVTYMRIKGLVPPSTERAQQQRRPTGN